MIIHIFEKLKFDVMKKYIYLLSFLLIICFACKNKKEIGILKKTEIISLIGTTWIQKRYSDGIYYESEIHFSDKQNGTMTFRNSTRMPATYPITYKQDGLIATIYNSESEKIFKVKIKSNNVFTLKSVDDTVPVSQYIRVTSK